MTDAKIILARLKALRDGADLSSRAAGRIARLIDRLDAPVRIAVFGLPGAGKAAVVNALAGEAVLAADAKAIPILVCHGAQAAMRITRVDGQTNDGTPVLPFTPPQGALLAELSLPLPALTRITLLHVATGPAPREVRAALVWAASRSDIALWCTQRWTAVERSLWGAAPDRLKNHAVLVATRGATMDCSDAPCPFAADACVIDSLGEALSLADAAALRDRLDRMIGAARAADLDAAAFLLAQHAAAPPAPESPVSAQVSQAMPIHAEAPRPVASNSHHPTLSRLVWHLRQTGARLAAALPADGLDEAGARQVLSALQDAVDAAVDLAEEDDGFADDWPALHETLLEAQTLLQLIKVEGRPRQAAEAAVLLGQVRQEVDHALAA